MTALAGIHGAFLAARAFFTLVRRPRELDAALSMVRGLSQPRYTAQMLAFLRTHPRGVDALQTRPRVGRLDLPSLRELPEGTLGRTFADFLSEEAIDPTALPTLPAESDDDYLMAHFYETHDIWHVATGFETDVAGELGLQAFYLAQMPGRVATLILSAGLLNTLLFAFEDRDRRMDAITRGWRLGKQAGPLFGYRWADHWDRPLEEVQTELALAA